MKLLNFSILKLTTYLIIGIIIAYYFKVSFEVALFQTLIFSLGLTLCYFLLSSASKFTYLFSGFVCLTFISIGVFSFKIYDETLQDLHYVNSDIEFSEYHNIKFKLTKRLKPDDYNTKYFIEIVNLNGNTSSGKILLNIKKDSLSQQFNIGDYFFVKSKLTEVVKPKNPFQFDYNKYLKNRNIHHQLYLNKSELLNLNHKENSLASYSDSFRNTINLRLKSAGFNNETLSIINALLLGQRQDISPTIYNNYVNAGVIHILAVSGLHVGIIYLILSFLLKPLHLIKYGKYVVKPILIIASLWFFAFITGLSPSVTRAVTMFSIITCAQFLNRPTNIYNTLTISVFIMLLFKPIYLFDIGFQMSYLAVFAIVLIQPMLYGLIKIPYKIPDYFWQIFTVTLAAQIGVIPISLFYFHQFPGLFFVSNLVIIPAVTVILSIGILVIVLALFNFTPNLIVRFLSYFIEKLNAFIGWIAQFENFLLQDIPFNIYYVLGAYLVIISSIYFWKTKHLKALNFLAFSIFILSGILVFTKYKNSTNEVVIFNKNRKTIIGEKQNLRLLINHNLDSITFKNDKTLKNYIVGNFINQSFSDNLKSVYANKNDILLVIDSLGIYNIERFKPKYILLTNSPKVNLNRLIDSLKPQQIIADASNYKSYISRWEVTCRAKKIPFHSTYEKGAFILK